MVAWAVEALRGEGCADPRLQRRLETLIGQLAAQPGASVPVACGDWAATKAAYRFWDNEAAEPERVREALAAATAARAAGRPLVLVVQDTTSLDFTGRAAMEGLGQVGNERGRGLLCHTALALTPAGWPLGIVHQEVWARPEAEGTTAERALRRRSQPIQEKESYRWLQAEAVTLARLPEAERVVTICDREGDIFDLFAHERRAGAELLVRSTHTTRRVETRAGERCSLAVAVRGATAVGHERVRVPRRNGQRERVVEVELRVVPVLVQPPAEPRARALRAGQEPVALWAVEAREVNPPKQVTPLRWLLLTTLSPERLGLEAAGFARQIVQWYRLRWLVERYHYVLKSGCGIEALQLQHADRLERALATFQAVAWGVLWLTLLSRAEPEMLASRALSDDEWRALWAYTEPGVSLPEEPPPLREVVRRIARLGGFLGRKGDGEPGLKTVWRGLCRLHDITLGWLAAQAAAESHGCG